MTKTKPIELKSVVPQLRAHAKACSGRWGVLTEMAGGAFSHRWLIAFANGRIKDPGFTKVVALGRLLGVRVEATSGANVLRPRG